MDGSIPDPEVGFEEGVFHKRDGACACPADIDFDSALVIFDPTVLDQECPAIWLIDG